jgi:hypothetical protein
VRTRTPGGVAGERPHKVAPYADSRDVNDEPTGRGVLDPRIRGG